METMHTVLMSATSAQHHHETTGVKHLTACERSDRSINNSLSILTAIFQVNLGEPVFIEAKEDGGGGDNWITGAISRAKLQSNHYHQQTNIHKNQQTNRLIND